MGDQGPPAPTSSHPGSISILQQGKDICEVIVLQDNIRKTLPFGFQYLSLYSNFFMDIEIASDIKVLESWLGNESIWEVVFGDAWD